MMLRLAVVVVLVAVAGVMAWVRLAPSSPERWHIDPSVGVSGPGSHLARITVPLAPDAALAALDAVAMAEPRTRRLAGSPSERRITWVSRSRVFGFPDYTTASAVAEGEGEGEGSTVVVFGRLRFGQSDLGVNAARVERWLADLRAATGGT